MLIGILKEPGNDPRVAMMPATVKLAKNLNTDIIIEKSAGEGAYVSDENYKEAGAEIDSRENILKKADLIVQFNPFTSDDIANAHENAHLIAMFQPYSNKELIEQIVTKGITAFSMDMIPRTSRAQTMDVLSSMGTIAGYKSVLIAAAELPKFFPMLTTAAGTIIPAKVLVLGAGVAGLMAIATARRMGGVVEAFDVRSAVKEEVQSLGAKFIEVEGAAEAAEAGGYAIEQSEDFLKKQQEKINEHAIKADIVITTAQIPGKKAPLLIPASVVEKMKKGSVIVDLAASSGGNCELTQNDKTINHNGIIISGYSNLPTTMPVDASGMYGKNVINFLKLIIKDGKLELNFEDDIVKGTCIAHKKEIIHEKIKELIN